MSKLKLFLENFLIYGMGGILQRLIPLLMLPVVTRLMPDTAYFGLSDLSNTVIQFGSALAVFGMYDAMYRMFFEKESPAFQKSVCSTTLTFTAGMAVLIAALMVLFRRLIARYFFRDLNYAYLVLIAAASVLSGSMNNIVSAPTRMQNRSKTFLVTNLVGSVISYSIAIFLILRRHYAIALPLASLISGLAIQAVFWKLNWKWFSLKRFDGNLLKELLTLAAPLVPNMLIYWIFNSSDRLMITNLLDIGHAGLYAIGAKLGHVSQLIYTAFAGGWQYFAFSTMKEEHQAESNSRIFEYLGVISFIATFFICACSYPVYRIAFPAEYTGGYIVAPYLFLAPLLQMLFQVACNQFLVIKKTWPNMLILSAGAALNVALNLILIPRVGIEGAAIATLLGYAVSVVICTATLIRIKLMTLSGRFLLAAGTMAAYFFLWRLRLQERTALSFVAAMIFSAFLLYLYREELVILKSAFKKSR